MSETDVIDGYKISCHVYINIENKSDIKPPYNIWILEKFIGCVEGTYGILLNGNHAVRLQRYRTAVAISAPRYMETALYGNRV